MHRRLDPVSEGRLAFLAETLDRRADELRDPLEHAAVDLQAVGALIDVGFVIEETTDRRRVGGYRPDAREPMIVLYRRPYSSGRFTPRERFTIAHEIAHHVIEEAGGFPAHRQAAYWRCEELCNQFASTLLLPPPYLDALPEPTGAEGLVELINAVSLVRETSAQATARALIPRLDLPAAAGGVEANALESSGRIGFRTWWVENTSWLGTAATRRAIYPLAPLAPVVTAITRLRPGAVTTPEIPGAGDTFLRRRRGKRASFAARIDPPGTQLPFITQSA